MQRKWHRNSRQKGGRKNTEKTEARNSGKIATFNGSGYSGITGFLQCTDADEHFPNLPEIPENVVMNDEEEGVAQPHHPNCRCSACVWRY